MGRIFGRQEHLWRIYKENVKRMREKKQEEEGRGIKKREKEFQEGEDSGKLGEEKRRQRAGEREKQEKRKKIRENKKGREEEEKKEQKEKREEVERRLEIRLFHPQHLDGIWIGQNQCRLPYAPLSEYPEPWF